MIATCNTHHCSFRNEPFTSSTEIFFPSERSTSCSREVHRVENISNDFMIKYHDDTIPNILDCTSEPQDVSKDTEGVLLLDIDQCSFYGNDVNDLGIIFQWMRRPQEQTVQLYTMLLNPCVLPTYEALKMRHAVVRVVLYTARSAMFNLRPSKRGQTVVKRAWNPSWIDGEQVYFPPQLSTADEIIDASADSLGELFPNERDDLRKKLERLLATRHAICEALSLDAVPDLVVTAAPKDVERTVRRLGYSTQHAYLWDDNEGLRGAPRVLTVPPFVRLAAGQRARVLAYLHEHVPPTALEPQLIDFLRGADAASRSITWTEAGVLEYRLPDGPAAAAAEPWPLPPIVAEEAQSECRRRRRHGDDEVLGGELLCEALMSL